MHTNFPDKGNFKKPGTCVHAGRRPLCAMFKNRDHYRGKIIVSICESTIFVYSMSLISCYNNYDSKY